MNVIERLIKRENLKNFIKEGPVAHQRREKNQEMLDL